MYGKIGKQGPRNDLLSIANGLDAGELSKGVQNYIHIVLYNWNITHITPCGAYGFTATPDAVNPIQPALFSQEYMTKNRINGGVATAENNAPSY